MRTRHARLLLTHARRATPPSLASQASSWSAAQVVATLQLRAAGYSTGSRASPSSKPHLHGAAAALLSTSPSSFAAARHSRSSLPASLAPALAAAGLGARQSGRSSLPSAALRAAAGAGAGGASASTSARPQSDQRWEEERTTAPPGAGASDAFPALPVLKEEPSPPAPSEDDPTPAAGTAAATHWKAVSARSAPPAVGAPGVASGGLLLCHPRRMAAVWAARVEPLLRTLEALLPAGAPPSRSPSPPAGSAREEDGEEEEAAAEERLAQHAQHAALAEALVRHGMVCTLACVLDSVRARLGSSRRGARRPAAATATAAAEAGSAGPTSPTRERECFCPTFNLQGLDSHDS